jgi:hypothetical protein
MATLATAAVWPDVIKTRGLRIFDGWHFEDTPLMAPDGRRIGRGLAASGAAASDDRIRGGPDDDTGDAPEAVFVRYGSETAGGSVAGGGVAGGSVAGGGVAGGGVADSGSGSGGGALGLEVPAPPEAVDVASAISDMAKAVADSRGDRFSRAFSMAFLAHLVGDAHQPLHAVSRGGWDVGFFFYRFFNRFSRHLFFFFFLSQPLSIILPCKANPTAQAVLFLLFAFTLQYVEPMLS